MITDAAFDELQDALYDLISYIGIGTGTTPATSSDTAIESEIYPDGANREALSSKTKVGNRKTAYIININKTECVGEDISEMALCNAAVAGDIYSHDVVSPIQKSANHALVIQLNVVMRGL